MQLNWPEELEDKTIVSAKCAWGYFYMKLMDRQGNTYEYLMSSEGDNADSWLVTPAIESLSMEEKYNLEVITREEYVSYIDNLKEQIEEQKREKELTEYRKLKAKYGGIE